VEKSTTEAEPERLSDGRIAKKSDSPQQVDLEIGKEVSVLDAGEGF